MNTLKHDTHLVVVIPKRTPHISRVWQVLDTINLWKSIIAEIHKLPATICEACKGSGVTKIAGMRDSCGQCYGIGETRPIFTIHWIEATSGYKEKTAAELGLKDLRVIHSSSNTFAVYATLDPRIPNGCQKSIDSNLLFEEMITR